MNNNIYHECLSNTQDLNLRDIQVKFQRYNDIPSLLTIYELIFPINTALARIKRSIDELKNDNLRENAIMGLFVLGYSSFEILLGDLLNRILYFYPCKITQSDCNKQNKKGLDYHVSKEILLSGEALKNAIDNKIETIRYKDLETILSVLQNYLRISVVIDSHYYDHLIEVKETRNLLLHNALIVNNLYLTKAEKCKRADKVGEMLTIDKIYSLQSLNLIYRVIEELNNQILMKYEKYTMLNLLDRLWKYTFKPHIKMKDYFSLNQENDIYDGPLKEGFIPLSSSEELLLDIWVAQRFGRGIRKFSLCLIDDRNIDKISFLTNVFGELRFTRW